MGSNRSPLQDDYTFASSKGQEQKDPGGFPSAELPGVLAICAEHEFGAPLMDTGSSKSDGLGPDDSSSGRGEWRD